jgi:excisionase family DNA binding protein
MTHKTAAEEEVASRNSARRGQTGPAENMRFFTITQVAELVAVSPRTVRRWIERKKLIAHDLEGIIRIVESDLRDFIARRCRK